MKKNNSIQTVVAVGIGAALFFVLGRFVAIPSPVHKYQSAVCSTGITCCYVRTICRWTDWIYRTYID